MTAKTTFDAPNCCSQAAQHLGDPGALKAAHHVTRWLDATSTVATSNRNIHSKSLRYSLPIPYGNPGHRARNEAVSDVPNSATCWWPCHHLPLLDIVPKSCCEGDTTLHNAIIPG
ncbi:hypothetical protein FS749_010616 [Ceratobasidium sp. UAMH 11750]|nr:hypothetical protein FS749_010616 [Ceratobasidium sp. UAMH 11750]